jgi:hypothetical protein
LITARRKRSSEFNIFIGTKALSEEKRKVKFINFLSRKLSDLRSSIGIFPSLTNWQISGFEFSEILTRFELKITLTLLPLEFKKRANAY